MFSDKSLNWSYPTHPLSRLERIYISCHLTCFPPSHHPRSTRCENKAKADLNHSNTQGVGLGFGPDVTRRWCQLNKVTAVIRSHEVRADGYAIEHDGLCITTFSCPNYCDTTGNKVKSFCFSSFYGSPTSDRPSIQLRLCLFALPLPPISWCV